MRYIICEIRQRAGMLSRRPKKQRNNFTFSDENVFHVGSLLFKGLRYSPNVEKGKAILHLISELHLLSKYPFEFYIFQREFTLILKGFSGQKSINWEKLVKEVAIFSK